MNKTKKIAAILVAATMATAGASLIAACGGGNSEYTIKQEYTETNKSEIPADMVNQVMFAYSETNATVETKLTLNDGEKTYTLYKSIITDKTEDETGKMDYAFKGEWEFTGTYTVSESNSNEITLKVPTSGKYNVYYPTVLNYQSIEKQTQDWVSSADYPTLLTRFNKWYPSKAETTVDQPVTLNGDTMIFGEVNLTVDAQPETPDDDDDQSGQQEDTSSWGIDESALVSVGADGKALNFYSDGTYKALYNAYNIQEEGTWTADSATHTLTLKVGDNISATGTVGGTGGITFTYTFVSVTQASVTQDFELTYTPCHTLGVI